MLENVEFPKSIHTVQLLDIGKTKLLSLLSSFSSIGIAVIGDCGLDAYWHANMEKSKLSEHTPLFVRPIYEQRYALAMAGNVARIIARLEVKNIHMLTALGDDWQGDLTKELLEQEGIYYESLIVSRKFRTPMLSRVYLHAQGVSQEDPRIDFLNLSGLPSEDEKLLIKSIEETLENVNGIALVENLQQSVMSTGIVDYLNRYANNHFIDMVVDSHFHIGKYKNMTLKMNQVEAIDYIKNKLSININSLPELIERMDEIQEQINDTVILTLGFLGCLLITADKVYRIPAIKISNRVNTLGAGDAFHAGYLAALCAGASEVESTILGNLLAGVVLKKNETEIGFASPEEIVTLFNSII